MKKQRLFASNLNLKIDGSTQKANPENQVINDLDEHLKEFENEPEEVEGLDTSLVEELMQDDEKFIDMLINTNDKAVQELQGGNSKESLHLLERLEKLLEYAAINKKILDRNLVIICLYNLACNHQALWVLEKCSKYVDGVIFNLQQSLKQDEVLLKESATHKLDSNQRSAIRAIKLRKLQFLVKVYLQHCAVLSQLSKHDEALAFAKKSHKLMGSIFAECVDCCKEAQKKIDSPVLQANQEDSRGSDFGLRNSKIFDSKRIIDEQNSIFRDEVSYLKNILEYATPFISDVIETLGSFSEDKQQDLLAQTRKSLFNWKNNPENNEKYLRKEFGRLPEELKDANRSLLGVQRPTEWLENLNIGSMMHMKPLKYKDYAQKKEFTNEITKDALQEKVINQSLIYFTIATEMRFLDMTDGSNVDPSENKHAQEDLKKKERYKTSEIYHLKSIEIVCRYVNKPCPYINHLISSYQKHYNQDLEVIPEESYYSTSEGATTHEVSREYETRNMTPFDRVDEILIKKKLPANKAELIIEKNKGKESPPMRPAKKNLSEQLKEDKGNLVSQTRPKDMEKIFIKKDLEEPKRKKDSQSDMDLKGRKSPTIKAKKKLGEDDEAKSVYTIASLSSRTLGLETLLSHNLSPLKLRNVNPPSVKENSKTNKLDKDDRKASPKYFVKKNYDTLNIQTDKVMERGMRTQASPERGSFEKGPGFMSERTINRDIYQKRPELQSSSPQKSLTEQNDPSVFLYKNFNKFIQNLYVDEQAKKARHEPKKESKLMNNPYSREIASATVLKKNNQSKRNTASQSTKTRQNQSITQTTPKNCSLSFGKPSYKDVEFKKVADLSPRSNKNSILSNTEEKDFKNKMVNKFAKSVSLKTISALDLKKVKSEKETSKIVSPRD